jgi:hypothetical protein
LFNLDLSLHVEKFIMFLYYSFPENILPKKKKMKTFYKKSIMQVPGLILALVIMIFIIIPGRIHAQWNYNTMVNILISNLPVADMQQVATTDGKTWIAYYHENSGNYDMRAQLIDADGYKLLGDNGILIGNYPSGSATYVYNVCIDSSNNLVVAYQDERSGTDQAVAYKVSQSGAMLWGADGIVLGDGLAPYPATLSNGETVIVWNESNSNTLKMQKISVSGTTAWVTPISIMVGSAKTTRGQVIANTNGKFSMIFQKLGTGPYTTLYCQMFDNSGAAVYQPLQICNQTTHAYRYYSVQAEGDTTYCGYYCASGSRFNSFVQRVNPNGAIPWGMNGSNFSTAVGANDPSQATTSINLTPGSPYVWSICTLMNSLQTQYGIYVQKFQKSDGGRQFTNTAKVVFPISGTSNQIAGELALVSDAPMFMYENSSYKLFATRLDENGNFVWPGNSLELSSTTATQGTPKMRYSFTPVGPNRCAGTWTEDRGLGYKGYAQGVSIGGLVGLVVATQNGVPAEITTDDGTLQLVATVYPATANQNVTWSIVPVTGMATISATGLVTAVSNGTVYAKATAVQDTTVSGTLLIIISGQNASTPTVVTLPATDITSSLATLNGSITANNLATTVTFEWGLDMTYGNTIDADPPTVSGTSSTPVLADLTGLQSYTTYHFRVKAVNLAGTAVGEDLTFTTAPAVGIPGNGKVSIDVYPSPNNGNFFISVSTGIETDMDLEVYNVTGSKICSRPDIKINGRQIIPADLTSYPNGVYTLVLRTGKDKTIRKVVLNR